MPIPKILHKGKYKYALVKQCNDNLFLYFEMNYGWKECFTRFELGLVHEVIAPAKEVKPEKLRSLN